MSNYPTWEWKLKRPEWADDEFADVKTIAWITLIDAIKKSVLCNDLGRLDRLATSNEAIKDMILAREWLVTDGMDGSVTRDLCLYVLSISKQVLFGTLRGLWRRMGKDMTSTINKKIKRNTEASRHQKRGIAKKKYWTMDDASEKQLLDKAVEMIRQTNKTVGV